jgi:ribosomal protein S27E
MGYNSPDPIDINCSDCGTLYTLFQTWQEPAVLQELKCKDCGHIVWRNLGGRRHNSLTNQDYTISGEYQGMIRRRNPPEDVSVCCEHDYQKERVMGAHTGDWKCTKCGDVRTSRP